MSDQPQSKKKVVRVDTAKTGAAKQAREANDPVWTPTPEAKATSKR